MIDSITPQKFLKRIELSSSMKFIMNSLNNSKIKMSKKVYNLQTRNIKQFIKQHREMELIKKEQKTTFKKQENLNKKYDENQLLQLEYQIRKNHNKYDYTQKCKTQPSELTQNSDHMNKNLNVSPKSNKFGNLQTLESNRIFINRPKRVTYIQALSINKPRHESSENLPRIVMRKKSNSTFEGFDKKLDFGSKLRITNIDKSEQSLKKSQSSIMEFSSKILSKKNVSHLLTSQQKLIEITEEKMARYIKSLHILVDGFYEYGRSLNEQRVNSLILSRYTSQRQLNINKRKLLDEEFEQKRFQLPHLQFISESETRKSIHRIINMSIKNTQKVVFKLLDFNNNGVIDEKDLVDLIQLSDKIPQLKFDLLRIAKLVCREDVFSNLNTISNAKSMSYREDSQHQIQKMKDATQRFQSIETPKKSEKQFIFPNKNENIKQKTESNSEITDPISPRKFNKKTKNQCSLFSKERLYSFLQTKNKFLNQKNIKQEYKFSVNLQNFHKVFGNQRPYAFYDLIKYLFNVKKQDLIKKKFGQFDESLNERKDTRQKSVESGFKNYDVPEIIKDMEQKFQFHISLEKYDEVFRIQKVSQISAIK